MVAIKGMEMPENCALCERFLGACKYTDFGDYQTERNPSCPLVEIVTCKDCKHREKVHPSYLSNKKDEVYFCTLQSDEYCYEVEDDHFCADGKRRE